jgi:hypothetical protein
VWLLLTGLTGLLLLIPLSTRWLVDLLEMAPRKRYGGVGRIPGRVPGVFCLVNPKWRLVIYPHVIYHYKKEIFDKYGLFEVNIISPGRFNFNYKICKTVRKYS